MHKSQCLPSVLVAAALCGWLLANLTSKLSPGSIRYTRTSQRLSQAWPKSTGLRVTECSHLWAARR
jgi:hypothetical protein